MTIALLVARLRFFRVGGLFDVFIVPIDNHLI